MDITLNPLLLQNVVLLIACLINLVMAIVVFQRGKHNKINLYFASLTFFAFLWSLGLLFSRSVEDLQLTSLFNRSTYISALAIIISLLYFTIYFPYKSAVLKMWQKIIIWLPAVILSILIYTPWFITGFITNYSKVEFISYYYLPGFILYAVYFITIAFWAMYYLWQKDKTTEGHDQRKIKLLLITIIVGLIFGSYFDLFILYFENFKYNWLGPIFTVFMNYVVFYFIFLSKDK